jgi:hypothetical protein
MFDDINTINIYELDKRDQVKCLIKYWSISIKKNQNRLPENFKSKQLNLDTIIELMTTVVHLGWEVSEDVMVVNDTSIKLQVGALYCAFLYYINILFYDERATYISSMWCSMCFDILNDLPDDIDAYELNLVESCIDRLLKSQGLAI